LGAVLEASGKKSAARKAMKKTLALDPKFQSARQWLKNARRKK